jgi:hypothetical protein
MTITAGPWEIHHYGDNEGDIYGANDALVCTMREGDTAPDDDWEDDARLIAAAPEMFAALQDARRTLVELYEAAYPNDESDNFATETIDRVTDLLRQITGENK